MDPVQYCDQVAGEKGAGLFVFLWFVLVWCLSWCHWWDVFCGCGSSSWKSFLRLLLNHDKILRCYLLMYTTTYQFFHYTYRGTWESTLHRLINETIRLII